MSEEVAEVKDTVEASGMSDEELNKAYNNAVGEENNSEPVSQEDTPSEKATESIESEKQDTSEPDPVEERLQSLEKQLDDKQSMIDRQGNEIGMLRKGAEMQKNEAIVPSSDEWREKFDEDPVAAMKEWDAYKEQEALQQEAAFEYENLGRRQYIESKIPNFNELLDEMVEIAKADGVPDAALRSFRDNPYADISSSIGLANRVMLQRQNARLQQELDKSKGESDRRLDEVEKAANASTHINGKSGQDAPDVKVNFNDATKLPDDLIKQELDKRMVPL